MMNKYSNINDLLKDLKISKDYMKNNWGMKYINISPNDNIVSVINSNKNNNIKVLEIGCDLGATLLAIKNKYPNTITYGIEIDSHSAFIAKHIVDYVYNYDIESNDKNTPLEVDTNIFNNSFDYIIFGDVLEHLRNSELVLEKCKNILKDDGYIVASIPNLMHISVMNQLINGRFTYTETGLLDNTHIHLFTKKEICNTFENAGYKLDKITSLSTAISEEDNKIILSLINLANNDSGVTKDMYTTFQYLCIASKIL